MKFRSEKYLPSVHECFTDEQIGVLESICDDSMFIMHSSTIVIRRGDLGAPDADEAQSLNRELDKVRKVIGGLSDEARSFIFRRHAESVDEVEYHDGSGESFMYKDVDDPVQQVLDAITDVKALKGVTRRKEIGYSALRLFKSYDIPAGTSETGDFVKYLAVILKASNLYHDPQKLARDIL